MYPATGILRRSGPDVRRLSNIPDLEEPGPSATPIVMTPPPQLLPSPAIQQAATSRQDLSRTLPRRFDPATGRAAPSDHRRAPLPQSFAVPPSSSFPNPYAQAPSNNDQRRSKPKTADIPPTPPLVQPTPAFGTGAPTTSAAAQSPRRALPAIPSGMPAAQISWAQDPAVDEGGDEEEEEEESDENNRWSSGESTPTPTASSVAAASARRKEAARDLVPVALVSPDLMAGPAPRVSLARSPAPRIQAQQQQQQAVSSSSSRPLSSGSSLMLADGREVPTVRTDFDNMKRFSRPSSSSQPTSMPEVRRGLEGSQASIGRKSAPTPAAGSHAKAASKQGRRSDDPLPTSTRAPDAPKLQQGLRFNKSDPALGTPEQSRPGTGTDAAGHVAPLVQPRRARDDIAALQTADRNTFGPDASLFEHANRALLRHQAEQQQQQQQRSSRPAPATLSTPNVPTTTALVDAESDERPRRPSNVESVRRSSFGSGTTALDTPNPEHRDSIDALYPNSGRRRSSSQEEGATWGRKAAGLVSGLAAPPSDVPELVEPSRSGASSRHQGRRRQGHNGDGEESDSYQGHWQPHQPMVVTTTANEARGDAKPPATSSSLRYVPIQNIAAPAPAALKGGQAAPARPLTAGSVTWRPGTGQTRFSAQSFRTRRLPSGHGNTPACRQCFRAGFDCAMNLQLGSGTGGRKAFQDFVNAGGLDAISIRTGGPNDQDDGASITVSQALGRNYVDKLGEVAFGESALSRPVTRGVVDDMLEERGRVMAEQQRSMSVENFLASLAKAKQEQDDEDEQRERDAQLERMGSELAKSAEQPMDNRDGVAKEAAPKSSIMTRPRAVTPSVAGQQQTMQIDPEDYASHGSSSSTSTLSDDLYFLADRWSVARKLWQLTVLCVWVFVIQALDAGYTTSLETIARDFQTMPISLMTGRMAYLWGEGGGLLLGSSLSILGRHRAPIFSTLAMGAVAIIAGFARSAVVLTILRGAMGMGAGIFQIMVLGSILDMTTTRRARCAATMYLLAWGIAGQASGPWIATLVISISNWRWLYWTTTIAAAVFAVLAGTFTAETAHETSYRDKVLEIRRRPYHLYPPQKGQQSTLQQEQQEQQRETPWMSEPRRLIRLRHFFRFYLWLPYLVLFTHALVLLSGAILAVFVGSLVLVLTGLPDVLTSRHGFSQHLASVTITVCVAIGCLLAAVGALLLLHWPTISGKEPPSNRSRLLFIDEKGYIDTSRPAHRPELLLRTALVGSLSSSVALYTLALTATTINWIFSALSLIVACAGVTLLALGIVTYLFESYYPAATAVLGEVIAEPDDLGPAPGFGRRHRSSSPSIVRREDECTLMSGADESGKRWPIKWALYSIAGALNVSFFIGGLMTLLGMFGESQPSFQLLLLTNTNEYRSCCSTRVAIRDLGRHCGKRQSGHLSPRRHPRPIRKRDATQHLCAHRKDGAAPLAQDETPHHFDCPIAVAQWNGGLHGTAALAPTGVANARERT